MTGLLTELNSFLTDANLDWCVCGGHAIDLFVGRKTRPHKDLDIAVFWEDRVKVIAYMLAKRWRILEPNKGRLFEITTPDEDPVAEDNLWCLAAGNPSYELTPLGQSLFDVTVSPTEQSNLDFIEFLFNRQEHGLFLYKRNHAITRALSKAIIRTPEMPYLAPELVLLYKSRFVNYLGKEQSAEISRMISDYRHDFDLATPLMDKEQREWLKSALTLDYPHGHEWLKRL